MSLFYVEPHLLMINCQKDTYLGPTAECANKFRGQTLDKFDALRLTLSVEPKSMLAACRSLIRSIVVMMTACYFEKG
jgi:hypothetical protein